MINKFFLWLIFLFLAIACNAQRSIPLYNGKIPGSKQVPDMEEWIANKDVDTIVNNVSAPTLTVFLPPDSLARGTAVIICPGGGYHVLLINREGSKVAKAFNEVGVAAFVLKYRLPSDRTMIDKSIGPIQDAQEAIKIVRLHAAEWHIDPNRIGIMGFSAGGHLAAMAGTHFEQNFIENKKSINLRPDFMLLIYPVISLADNIGHIGSRNYLLGTSPSKEKIRFFSNELQVTRRTPPTFLAQATGDSVVSSKNSLYFYEALHRNGVPVELHLYERGEHGFLTAPPFEEWFERCIYWMRANGWIF
ncbi:MAG: alpha/beta hydrolase [Ginsengibacter sp.]